MLFVIDFDVLVTQLLPVRLRQAVQTAWLKCLVSPVKYIYTLFFSNRTANLYWLEHDSQVCYLDAVLNDTFDHVLRRIFISDPVYRDPVYLYLELEAKPVMTFLISEIGTSLLTPPPEPVPLFLDSELYTGSGATFIVNIPLSLVLTLGPQAQLQALVNKYRLPGRTYTLAFF